MIFSVDAKNLTTSQSDHSTLTTESQNFTNMLTVTPKYDDLITEHYESNITDENFSNLSTIDVILTTSEKQTMTTLLSSPVTTVETTTMPTESTQTSMKSIFTLTAGVQNTTEASPTAAKLNSQNQNIADGRTTYFYKFTTMRPRKCFAFFEFN